MNVFGNVQISTQAVQSLLGAGIPIVYFSQGGWYYGTTHGLGEKNVFLRMTQFATAQDPQRCLAIARSLVGGKIRNARTLLQRNHIEPPRRALDLLKCLVDQALAAASLEELLGIEGNAARIYFENFSGMIKFPSQTTGGHDPGDHTPVPEDHVDAGSSPFVFDFRRRNRRPPRDPVNALLSLAYSVLAKDLSVVCHAVGFDPYLGFFHQPRYGRPSLALDLMEPFRPLIADSVVLSAINTKMIGPEHFIRVGPSVALKPEGRRGFFRAYEQRMDSLVTHPILGYRASYRRILEVQTRLLARYLLGEIAEYQAFTTR